MYIVLLFLDAFFNIDVIIKRTHEYLISFVIMMEFLERSVSNQLCYHQDIKYRLLIFIRYDHFRLPSCSEVPFLSQFEAVRLFPEYLLIRNVCHFRNTGYFKDHLVLNIPNITKVPIFSGCYRSDSWRIFFEVFVVADHKRGVGGWSVA